MRVGSRSRATKILGIASFAAAMLVAVPSAGAAVTIGQTGTPTTVCANNADRLQPTVISGNSYVVPATVASGTITSWSTQAIAGAGRRLALKVYRPLGGGIFQVVGQAGPHDLTGGILNTFQANVPVRAGDILGNSVEPTGGSPGCNFPVTGENYVTRTGNLPVGASGDFVPGTANRRQNISAVVNPTNTFTIGAVTRNKKKGIAFMQVTVPNPGTLALSGGGALSKVASGPAAGKAVASPGTVQLKVKTTKKKKLAKLNSTGKVQVSPTITFTPTGGDPASQTRKVQLRKNI
jgi:hypothetical protein